MKYHVDAEFIAPKSGNMDDCEDLIVVTPHHVAVIDGATSKLDETIDGQTPGQAIMLVVAEAIRQLRPEISARDAVLDISRQVREWKAQLHQPYTQSPTASIVLFSALRGEIWSIGDCMYLIDGQSFYKPKKIDAIATEFRSALIEAVLEGGEESIATLQGHDLGRDAVVELLKRQTIFQNRHDHHLGYGVIDGNPLAADFLEVHDVSGARQIILSSDGYPKLLPSLAESERFLKRILHEDPLMFRAFASTKGMKQGDASFDDRAFIELRLS